MTLLEKRALADVLGTRRGHTGLGWALNPRTGVLRRGGENSQTQSRAGEDERGHRRNGARSQGLSTASSFSEARTRGMEQILPLSLQQEPILPTP